MLKAYCPYCGNLEEFYGGVGIEQVECSLCYEIFYVKINSGTFDNIVKGVAKDTEELNRLTTRCPHCGETFFYNPLGSTNFHVEISPTHNGPFKVKCDECAKEFYIYVHNSAIIATAENLEELKKLLELKKSFQNKENNNWDISTEL